MRHRKFFLTLVLTVLASLSARILAQNITCTAEDKDMITCLVTISGVKEKKAVQAAESALRYAIFLEEYLTRSIARHLWLALMRVLHLLIPSILGKCSTRTGFHLS